MPSEIALPLTQAEVDALYTEKLIRSPLTHDEYKKNRRSDTNLDDVRRLIELKDTLKRLIRDKLCSLSNVQLNAPTTHLFQFTDASGQHQGFSILTALRLAIGKTATPELVDFLISPLKQGFMMTDARERRTDEGIVNKIVLTANQAKMWLMPDVSPMSVEQRKRSRELAVQLGLKSYDYVAVPIIKRYAEPGQVVRRTSLYNHVLFVIFCGFSEKVQKRLVWFDSLWFKPTFDETTGKTLRVNMARSADFSKNEYHGLQTFRKRALQSLQPWTSVPQTSTPAFKAADFFPSFVRTDSYEEFGHGIAACMSFAKLWRSPLAYFGGAVPPRQDPNSEEVEKAHFFGAKELQPDDIWYDLWSIGDRKNHARTAHATTIAFEKVIAAAARAQPPSSNDPPPNPVENFADLGGIAVTGSDVDSCLWPEVYIGAWRAYKILEKERRLPMLFYIVFHEKHLATYNLDQEER